MKNPYLLVIFIQTGGTRSCMGTTPNFFTSHKITLSVNENRVIFTTKFLFLAFIYHLMSISLKQLVLQKVGMKTQRVILKLKTTIFISALPRYFEEPQHRYHHASELWKTCPSCGFSCYYGS